MKFNPIVILISVLVTLLSFFIIDWAGSNASYFNGIVIDKNYKPEINSYGNGYNAKGGLIMTTLHEDEKFILFVQTKAGEILTVETHPELYFHKEVGQPVNCKEYKGLFTNITYSVYGEY